ncbi:uncharacterized protein LOC103180297 [Callorhinchus milii]|uniref:uncharacterized protein LOC103180297 n=1 Tax=Callorhinchus milii TaxID=7868 RepID=UPI001C3F9805|nr:uncharacterized protein LOC103180297 [Callorhinchus milii]
MVMLSAPDKTIHQDTSGPGVKEMELGVIRMRVEENRFTNWVNRPVEYGNFPKVWNKESCLYLSYPRAAIDCESSHLLRERGRGREGEAMAFANPGHLIPQLKLEDAAEDNLFKNMSLRSLQQVQHPRSKAPSPAGPRHPGEDRALNWNNCSIGQTKAVSSEIPPALS